MLFNSAHYLLFFPIVVIIYFLVSKRYRWIVLLAASYYFYMSWNPIYIGLIIISTIIDYLCGCAMGKIDDRTKRKPYLYISLLTNLGILFSFKYFDFFIESFSQLLGLLNLDYAIPSLNVLLPVGISFYTFQTMSYSIDVYYDRIKPEKHLGIFAVFVSFFPQLVAGPIERASNLLPQFRVDTSFDIQRITSGLLLIGWGLFKKVVIADNIAILVEIVYSEPVGLPGNILILGTVLFAFQIFCDFSGYSDIAIGSAKVLGIDLMENFRRPYYSKSVSEFWKRWHISLSSWFRDYVYIPLGGNRVIKWRWYYNLFITFLVSGLWHGANWTFVIWGALHGFYLISAIVISKYININFSSRSQLGKFLDVLVVFSLVCFAWIFFRADNLDDAFYVCAHLFDNWSINVNTISDQFSISNSIHWQLYNKRYILILSIIAIGVMEFIHLLQRKASVREQLRTKPIYIQWSLYCMMIFSIVLFSFKSDYQFIYFQF
jgi:D-alanyl-lipoteichoic acid acyltransferase DltB (MBOAT superfamily)